MSREREEEELIQDVREGYGDKRPSQTGAESDKQREEEREKKDKQ